MLRVGFNITTSLFQTWRLPYRLSLLRLSHLLNFRESRNIFGDAPRRDASRLQRILLPSFHVAGLVSRRDFHYRDILLEILPSLPQKAPPRICAAPFTEKLCAKFEDIIVRKLTALQRRNLPSLGGAISLEYSFYFIAFILVVVSETVLWETWNESRRIKISYVPTRAVYLQRWIFSFLLSPGKKENTRHFVCAESFF